MNTLVKFFVVCIALVPKIPAWYSGQTMAESPALPPRQIGSVDIDRELCIGASSCIAVAAEAFALDGENKAVLKPHWATLTDEELLSAAKACPVAAIILRGQDGKQVYPDAWRGLPDVHLFSILKYYNL